MDGYGLARSAPRSGWCSVTSTHWLVRMVASALVRRVVYVVVALALTGLGIGTARAQDQTCSGESGATQCTKEQAYSYCKAHESQAAAALAAGGLTYTNLGCVINTDNGTAGAWRCSYTRLSSSRACREAINVGNPGNRFYYFNRHCDAGRQYNTANNTCELVCPGGFGEDAYNPGTCMTSQKCLAKNSGLAKGPTTRQWNNAVCQSTLDGCKLAMVASEAQVAVDGFYTGVFEYTGDSCATKATTEAQAKEQPKDVCRPVPGTSHNFCIKPTGEQCLTTKTAGQVCWRPTETGEKKHDETLQKRVVGPNEIPPSLTLPDGNTLQKSDESVTKTTTVRNRDGTYTTITTTTTNYVTTNGASIPGPNQGEEASKDGDPAEGGDEGSATGGGDCDTPPVTTGDPVVGMVARQAWETRCAVDKTNAVTTTGSITDCSAPFTVEGNTANAIKLRSMRKSNCPLEGEAAPAEASYLGDGTGEPSASDVMSTRTWGADGFDQSGFGWGQACPALPTIEFRGTTINLDPNGTFCDWMTLGGFFVVLMAGLACFRILMSA